MLGITFEQEQQTLLAAVDSAFTDKVTKQRLKQQLKHH